MRITGKPSGSLLLTVKNKKQTNKQEKARQAGVIMRDHFTHTLRVPLKSAICTSSAFPEFCAKIIYDMGSAITIALCDGFTDNNQTFNLLLVFSLASVVLRKSVHNRKR